MSSTIKHCLRRKDREESQPAIIQRKGCDLTGRLALSIYGIKIDWDSFCEGSRFYMVVFSGLRPLWHHGSQIQTHKIVHLRILSESSIFETLTEHNISGVGLVSLSVQRIEDVIFSDGLRAMQVANHGGSMQVCDNTLICVLIYW